MHCFETLADAVSALVAMARGKIGEIAPTPPCYHFCYPITRHETRQGGMAAGPMVCFGPENIDSEERVRTSRYHRRCRGGGPTVESEFAFRIDIDALRRDGLIRLGARAGCVIRFSHAYREARCGMRNPYRWSLGGLGSVEIRNDRLLDRRTTRN